MNAIATQYRGGSSSDPNPSERVGVHFVLLDEALALLVHVYPAVLAVMDLVVPHYRVTVCANLWTINHL